MFAVKLRVTIKSLLTGVLLPNGSSLLIGYVAQQIPRKICTKGLLWKHGLGENLEKHTKGEQRPA